MRTTVDLRTAVGSVALPNPVLTASGTAGHGAELAAYVDLSSLGAVVVKSVAPGPWPGNPAPRVHDTPAGMINSVGLQGPGVAAWIADELPALYQHGARVVASIWGRHVEDYARAAELLVNAPGVIAVEVNVSCPNLDDRSRMFAHSAAATAGAVAAAASCGLPRWAKLSPNVPDIVEIAGAALDAGADALVLVNTLLGMAIDTRRRTYRLGSGPAGGGLSGPAIRPVAVRAVHDCRAAFPHAGIVGVGGVAKGADVAEMLLAGADAVEVGTATFRDPRAPARVLSGFVRWCRLHDVASARELVGAVHRSSQGASSPTPAFVTERPPAPPATAAPRTSPQRPPAPPAAPVSPAAPVFASPPADGEVSGPLPPRPPVTRPQVRPRVPPTGPARPESRPTRPDDG